MADLPIENKEVKQIKVTQENFGPILVHYAQLIYGRLGYLIKLLEKQKENS